VASAYCVGFGWKSWLCGRRSASSICVVERATGMPLPRGRHAPGFTLLEVLVAMAILSLAVVTVIQGFASGLRLLKLSGEHQEAMLIADLKLREITAPTQAGRDAGTEGRYTWEREVKQVVTPDLEIEGRTVKWHQWEVDVHVRWGDHREVSVSTLRTVAGDGDRNLNNPTGLPRS
jgi:type II secretion system protein I